MTKRLTAGILIYNNVDDLDFMGPLEVFTQVRLNEERRFAERTPIEILLVAQNEELVRTFGGMLVAQDCAFGECPPLDILVVPGGMGERLENHNPAILGFIRSRAGEVKTLASVSTGSFLLAGAGVLDGRTATTHYQSIDRMKDSFPKVKVEEGVRFVEDGKIITSAGISSGIDMTLRLVAINFGGDIARATARWIEYPCPEGNYRIIEG
ncbi:MAG: DJ-1/PfpI family protein [Thermodesulfobacteriota bacterium]